VSTDQDGAGLFETASDREALERAAAAAAPVAPERADPALVQGLDPSLRPAMFDLLSSLADNKYLLGRRYAEWCTGAPLLESAVAAAAMAQDELGHARSFYPLLRGFPQAQGTTSMEERGWQKRATSAVACLDRPFRSWSEFVATNLVVDTAFSTLLGAAVDSPYEPLRQRARKILQEEMAHWVHASGWTRRLAEDPATRPALVSALEARWPDAATWFGADDDATLARLGAAAVLHETPDGLRRALCVRLAPVLAGAGLDAEFLAAPLPWERWDAAGRRLRGPLSA
jgi:phenylacetate-CoA oxygenase PaaI subunit